jgi:hypothetical protein
VDLDEWIDIYNGESWEREKQKNEERSQLLRENQQPTTYIMSEFNNTFVVDERNLYYLGLELERVIGIHGNEDMAMYCDRLQHFFNADDKLPIYDI